MWQKLMALAFGWLILQWAVVNAAADPGAGSAAHPIAATMAGDAAIVDVCFVDRQCGWAVGERGVIWHTEDGGTSWQQQQSNVSCRLGSVCFLNAQYGWVAGGTNRPYSERTQGVVLRTSDGGKTWTTVARLLLPRLARVEFFNLNDGVAFGEGSSFFPSGVFVTRDGGRNWQTLPSNGAGPWLAGDFLDPATGAVAGVAGRFATIAQRQVLHSPLASTSIRAFRALRLVSPTGGWLVGDGGLVMKTGDLGRSWQSPDALPIDVLGHFDFHAIAVHGSNVWLAGTPGTRVFRSTDGGQSWQGFATGQTVPIRAITFVDATHGWAVGELGSILATQDGGQKWHVQRAGGRRAALLAIFADGADVPLELIAEQGAAEGYLTGVELLHPTANDADKVREAVVLAGATSADAAWRFPLPPADLALGPNELIEALNRANDGRALQQIESYLVRELRTWQPDVVVTHRAREAGGKSIAGLVERMVLRSIHAAADSTQSLELATSTGLSTWQVKRAYGVLPSGSRGDQSINTGRFVARLGGSLTDWSAPARRLIADRPMEVPDSIELELLMDRTTTEAGPRGLFGGIPLSPGGEARRPPASDLIGDVDDLRRVATRRRQLRELLARTEGNAAWVGQVERITEGLDAAGGGELLFQLAGGYRDSGRLDLAADTYYLLVRRYPDHPLADQALVWLVQFYASSEAAGRSGKQTVVNVRQSEGEVENHSQRAAGDEVEQASAVAPIGADAAPVVGLSREDRLRRAVQLGEYLEATRPLVYAEPAVRFPLVAAQRELGFANPAKRYFLTMGQLPENDPWRRCAETEEWLTKPGDSPPSKVLGHCRMAGERPHLDGWLDEPFWEAADVLRLQGNNVGIVSVDESANDAAAETDRIVRPTVRLAYDVAFLYVAVQCPKVAGGDYRVESGPRPRDADLTEHDRVSLRLDVDRDFTTWFELVVDHRGWTREACWGETAWDPAWFVAAADDAETWTVEAAVPLAELVPAAPTSRHVWAASVRRTMPRVGYETWSGEGGEADSPDAFGLLIFE